MKENSFSERIFLSTKHLKAQQCTLVKCLQRHDFTGLFLRPCALQVDMCMTSLSRHINIKASLLNLYNVFKLCNV